MSSSAEGFLAPYLGHYMPWLYTESMWWTIFGFIGTLTFGSRFILQWIHSERAKKVVVPEIFWQLSFWGSVLTLVYFIHIDKAPAILGNCFLPFLYGRNLYLLHRHVPIADAGDSKGG
jgi:lipid-A-disaccharide synthase-like uncharacterized protein